VAVEEAAAREKKYEFIQNLSFIYAAKIREVVQASSGYLLVENES
jgi:hypothetical protein